MSDTALILCGALLLDAVLGEPKWLWDRIPHPAVLMGRLISWADRRFNTGTTQRENGIAMMIALSLGAVVLGTLISLLLGAPLIELVIVAVLLAHRSLCDHVSEVARDLRYGLPAGRRAVARIVGRDTADMDQPAVARAAIESAAENLSDGVVAPALFYLVFGLPGLLLYKFTNTADSMIGYRTPRHEAFGWAAARFDDLLNWLPSRVTALMIAITHSWPASWRDITSDARKHRSPNAGWPEAAMARSLDIALAGPRSYDGATRQFPFVHPDGQREIGPPEIDRAVISLWRVWIALVATSAALALL